MEWKCSYANFVKNCVFGYDSSDDLNMLEFKEWLWQTFKSKKLSSHINYHSKWLWCKRKATNRMIIIWNKFYTLVDK